METCLSTLGTRPLERTDHGRCHISPVHVHDGHIYVYLSEKIRVQPAQGIASEDYPPYFGHFPYWHLHLRHRHFSGYLARSIPASRSGSECLESGVHLADTHTHTGRVAASCPVLRNRLPAGNHHPTPAPSLPAASLLAAYYGILLAGNGFIYGPENILAHADQWVLGLSHMYNDNGIDPEGVLSTIPSVAHVLIGFCFGKICLETPDMKDKLNRLFLYGAILLITGFLLQDLCPLNKKVWSPTFVMVTCGFSALLLGVLSWYTDVTRQWRQVQAFTVFGVNPLFCYVLSELLYILVDSLPLKGQSLHGTIYSALSRWVGDNAFASLLYALLFVLAVWVVGAYLRKKNIYIKI